MLSSHWTLVTGGCKRLGAEICLSLAKEGYNVIVHYNTSKNAAADVAEQCRKHGVQAEIIQGDFSTPDKVELFTQEYLSRFPETDNIINNVGNYLVKSLLETSLDEMTTLFQANLFAPFQLIQKLLFCVKKQQGSIINIGFAGVNSIKADVYATAYILTKSGLLLLTKSLAKELCPFNVRVNMVSPGYIDNAVDLPEDLSSLPMGRAASSEEVARVIIFLLKKENSYITGQNIEVAGGVLL
jgi:NAD(P)-dependent dehydrogenase (short-subunit alcohol dehydrogenase family)